MPIPDDFFRMLSSGALSYGIHLDDTALALFKRYTDILTVWNEKMNLVSKRDMERFLEYHLLDSLKIASCVDMAAIGKVLDFGSGAGLPEFR